MFLFPAVANQSVPGGGGGPTYVADNYSFAAVYDLRQLSSSITHVCRLERTDNTERLFTATELIDGTLAAWAGAGSAYIETLFDQSGNGNDFSVFTGTSGPVVYSSGSIITDANGNIGWKNGVAPLTPSLNGGTRIKTFSIFATIEHAGTSRNDSWGLDGSTPYFKPSEDYSLRYGNGFTSGTLTPAAGIHLRSTFHTSSNVLNDYIDGVQNINAASTGTRDFPDTAIISASSSQVSYGLLVALSDLLSSRATIESEWASAYA